MQKPERTKPFYKIKTQKHIFKLGGAVKILKKKKLEEETRETHLSQRVAYGGATM